MRFPSKLCRIKLRKAGLQMKGGSEVRSAKTPDDLPGACSVSSANAPRRAGFSPYRFKGMSSVACAALCCCPGSVNRVSVDLQKVISVLHKPNVSLGLVPGNLCNR